MKWKAETCLREMILFFLFSESCFGFPYKLFSVLGIIIREMLDFGDRKLYKL